MDAVFIKLLNMSITASWLILAVVLLRFLLKKASKRVMGVLWGFVAIRLIFPFSLESVFSLVPSAEPIPQDIAMAETPAIQSGFPIFNQIVNPILSESLSPSAGDSVNPMQVVISVASVIWILGVFAMLLYALVSYIRIHRKVRESVPLENNIWICDHISTPFILGMIRPRIYLPSSMNEADMAFVVSHEKAHLKRKDHIWKPLGFLLLSVYWFNPILWAAYILLCRDIELACDEQVIRQLGAEMKKPYSDALINCSAPRRMVAACPLAFGETGVKERVKGVLHYKKPAFWMIVAAAAACIVTAVCLLTNPMPTPAGLPDDLAVFLDGQIAAHHQSAHTGSNFSCVDYDILKVKKSGTEVSVYAWVLYEEYSYDGALKIEAGAHTPTVITANKQDGQYHLTEYWTPRDGSYYAGDIKDKFPMYLWGKALDSQKYIDEQKERCLQHAMEYYGVAGDGAANAAKPAGNPSVYYCLSGQDRATLTLEPQSKGFSFSCSLLSSYMAVGTYEEDGEFIVAVTDDGSQKYTFQKSGPNMVFIADQSSPMPGYAYSPGDKAEVCLADGAVFQPAETEDTQPGGNPYFNAEVLEVSEKSILVKPDKDSAEIRSADKISVSLDMISTIPIPAFQAGDRVRIIYNGEILESYPAQINQVFVVYLLGDDGSVLSPTPLR